ncbi:hypothetical protein Tco_0791348 [Tanacetum coccineum]
MTASVITSSQPFFLGISYSSTHTHEDLCTDRVTQLDNALFRPNKSTPESRRTRFHFLISLKLSDHNTIHLPSCYPLAIPNSESSSTDYYAALHTATKSAFLRKHLGRGGTFKITLIFALSTSSPALDTLCPSTIPSLTMK